MNFVLHHHLAREETGSPAAAIGAMLPDLWRMADRRVRPRRPSRDRPAGPEPDDPRARRMAEGVRHHLEADAWFHASAHLRDGERRLRQAFAARGLDQARMGLLAHIGWELALDGALVRTLGPEAARARIDADFAAHEDVLGVVQLRETRGPAPPGFQGGFTALTRRLRESSWIPGYADAPGLAARLAAVRRRVGLADLATADRRALEDVCAEIGPRADRGLARLLADRAAVAAPRFRPPRPGGVTHRRDR